jgi:type I restriction-modification system DNA methylase subunit
MFQQSVLKKYLAGQDKAKVAEAFARYRAHFLDAQRQENIRNLKEEQYQEGFLRELFVGVLGYTLNPDSGFNLTTELKNIGNAKKTDGAILRADGAALAVIELKGTDTKDLDKVSDQAFGYKNNQPECVYVITSNFEKLRFYVQNAVEHEEFNLFKLTEERFALLHLFLQKDNLLGGLPLKVKDESLKEEKEVTNRLYKDYSLFKRELWQNMVAHNPQHDPLLLYKKSQKLLDRFLFILFAEDKGLLPPNMISTSIAKWKQLRQLDFPQPLYEVFKQQFSFINTGHKTNDIFAYNGGLFNADELLDSLVLSDALLETHVSKLTRYDFATEVDTNILGHIFEHSLNDIETVRAELAGEVVDKSKTKRKKDGVFYTPKYITKYIVDNTVGRLCEEKKREIGIDEEEFAKDRKGRKKETLKRLDEQLKTYRDWLLQLTICDPACGSGAFLNQALEFLMAEHRYVDELEAQLLGYDFEFPGVEAHILEHNIYGVDINEESVEIARLSLWLRTAQKGRKLTTLSSNIKAGNSLIDDPAVAGELAFDWKKEFPKVFEKGGFDVVIGNPPYVSAIEIKKSLSNEEFNHLKKSYETAKGAVDLYIYFFERGLKILQANGYLAYITPNRFLSASYGEALRDFLLENTQIISLIDYSDKRVFPDASTYPVITFLKIGVEEKYHLKSGRFDENTMQFVGKDFHSDKLGIIEGNILGFLLNDKLPITEKIINQSTNLGDAAIINATSTAKEADDYSHLINEESGFKLVNTGTLDPYQSFWGYWELTDKGSKYLRPFLKNDGLTISQSRLSLYGSPKLIVAKIGLSCEVFYDRLGQYASINTNCLHSFTEDYLPEYILCWMNSKLYNYMFECLFDGLRMSGGYLLFSAPNLKSTYIKPIELHLQKRFIPLSIEIETLKIQLLDNTFSFLEFLSAKVEIAVLSKNLESWPTLDFKGFLAELKKGKVQLSLSEEAEWMAYFNAQKQKANALQAEIDRLDKEIDRMVYQLYGLTEEEIKVVEG